MNEQLRLKLEKLAEREISADNVDFNIFEASGGNYDDAYSIGTNHGEVWLARQLLKEFYPVMAEPFCKREKGHDCETAPATPQCSSEQAK